MVHDMLGTVGSTMRGHIEGAQTPAHPMLNGERAIDLINKGRTEEVLAVIESLDPGAFTQVPQDARRPPSR